MFNPCTKQAVIEAAKRLTTKGKILDFGNQTYDAGTDYTSVADFYRSLGFVDYVALDVNGHGTVICDLNYEVEGEPVSLVVNNGTSEHIFNQAAIFFNAHKLCEVNGLILHILPFTRWLNHGFYNYNPILFRDLAAANDYKIEFFYVSDRHSKKYEVGNDLYLEKHPRRLEAIPADAEVFNVVCFRKTNNEDFKFPIQGKYVKDLHESLDYVQRISESHEGRDVSIPSSSGPRLPPSELLRRVGKE